MRRGRASVVQGCRLVGQRDLAAMISAHILLDPLDQGFTRLERGETVRSVVMFGDVAA